MHDAMFNIIPMKLLTNPIFFFIGSATESQYLFEMSQVRLKVSLAKSSNMRSTWAYAFGQQSFDSWEE